MQIFCIIIIQMLIRIVWIIICLISTGTTNFRLYLQHKNTGIFFFKNILLLLIICFCHSVSILLNNLEIVKRTVTILRTWHLRNLIQDKEADINYNSKCRSALSTYLRNKEMTIIPSDNVGKFYRYVNSKLGNTLTVHRVEIIYCH